MSIKNKRNFDLLITLFIFPIWLIILILITIFLFLIDHRPVFFSQIRVVSKGKEKRIYKFRSMNSQKVKTYLKSESLQKERRTGFTSIDPSTGVYTKIGIILESIKLVELPEIFHVLRGDLSIVGNRALPIYLQNQLEENDPNAKKRLLTKAGIFGVIQMAGRQNFNSKERLQIEVLYSELQFNDYSLKLDIVITIISFLRLFKFKLIDNHDDIYMILKDKSFSNLGLLIKRKIKASSPTKQ